MIRDEISVVVVVIIIIIEMTDKYLKYHFNILNIGLKKPADPKDKKSQILNCSELFFLLKNIHKIQYYYSYANCESDYIGLSPPP